MSGGSRPPALNMGRSLPSQCVIGVIVTITCFGSVTSRAAKTDIQQYSVVARVGAKSAGLTSRDIIVRVGKVSVPATDIQSSPDVPRNIAIVMDHRRDALPSLIALEGLAKKKSATPGSGTQIWMRLRKNMMWIS